MPHRKRGEHYPPNEIKKGIIKYLLTQPSGIEEPKIRDHLKVQYGISEPKNIKMHFKELQKSDCIKKIEAVGLANRWVIENFIQVKNIAKKYPELVSDLQKNDMVLLILVENHDWIFSIPKPKILEAIRDSEWYLHLCEFGQELPMAHLQQYGRSYEKDVEEASEKFREELKAKLRLSTTFFELFLKNEPEYLKNIFRDFFWLTDIGQAFEYVSKKFGVEDFYGLNEFLRYTTASEEIFKICISTDVLNGNKNSEAIELVKELNKYSPVFNEIIGALHDMKKRFNFSSPSFRQRIVSQVILSGGYPKIERKID